jgi:tellurite resistance protein TehA-like permease
MSSKSRWNPFDDEERYVDRFGLLLLITVLAVVMLSLVDLSRGVEDLAADIGLLIVSVFVGATLLLALRASGVARRYRIIADVLIGIGVLATSTIVLLEIFTEFEPTQTASRTPNLVWILLATIAPIVVVRRLIQHNRASGKTLLGAVSAYLLIALAFNFAFLALDSISEPFFGQDEPTTSFTYFSLVTITTLGYGDLAAAEPLGRLLTTIEAVIGQVYLVTFVAMIVGLMVEQRQARVRNGSEDDQQRSRQTE